MEKKITVLNDEDGYSLLQCHLCREYFKLPSNILNEESYINIWCPYCGLDGKNYVTQEMLEVGLRMAENEINEMIYDTLKEFERKTRNNKFVSFKAGKKSQKNTIIPIKERIENLEIKELKCCKSKVKIRPINKMCGNYCPLCGGIDYE